VGLGLFVLWQLFFLFFDNLLDLEGALRDAVRRGPLVQDRPPGWLEDKGPVRPSLTWPEAGATFWGELTGQEQAWRLFAPDVADVIPFVALELRWEDGTSCPLLSDNEPDQRRRFLRLGRFRLRRYESKLEVAPSFEQGEPSAAAWAKVIAERVEADEARVRAYLRYRLAQYRRQWPALPAPAEVLLLTRLTRVPPPPGPAPWDWEDLGPHVVARWRPGAGEGAPLEAYDPVRGRFEAAKKKP
jgi:hypothetical protein